MEVATITAGRLERFDHRRALQLLSHAARTRNLQTPAVATFSFIVHFDVAAAAEARAR